METLLIIIFALSFLFVCYMFYRLVISLFLFRFDKYNPYRRYCKKCNSHQVMYSSNIEGQENDHWWEEVYPIGNNEKCKCHSFSEYRS